MRPAVRDRERMAHVSLSHLRVLGSGTTGQLQLSDLIEALRDALATGPPLAPLPADPVAAQRVQRMLQPELGVSEPEAAAVVATSGTTADPKGVVLSRPAIAASAHATHRRLGGPGRWLLALAPHYVAGLMVVARSVLADTPVIDVGQDLGGLPKAVERPPGQRCYLSLVPTQLVRALREPGLTTALANIDAVLLGGAPASDELMDKARAAGINVVTTYGMSETCGGCVYDGIPLDNVHLCLAPESDDLASVSSHRAGRDDNRRVLLGGPMLFSGYRLRPDLTEQSLVDDTLRTNDRGTLAQGRLRLLGRFDDLMISGGLKIDRAAVETAVHGWPDLDGHDVAVVGAPDPEWGTKLVAYAEAADGGTHLCLDRLRTYLDSRIAHHEQPKDLIVRPQLPRTSGGKIDLRQLSADYSGRAGHIGSTHHESEETR